MDKKPLIPATGSNMKAQKRVAVIGASGYGGLQTIRLLQDHPKFRVSFLGGKRSSGKSWNQFFPFLPLDEHLTIQDPNPQKIAEAADYAVLSLPNGESSQLVPKLLEHKIRVVDLSADFRYRSLEQWSQVYAHESSRLHRNDPVLCKEAVYGLAEWKEEEISHANLVAAPGCFPTASLLPLLPFLKQGLIEEEGIIIDAKTGTSGGGRAPKETFLLAEASESISPYGVVGHRHTSEIEQLASEIAGHTIQVQFTPHLVPMVRGLLATVYGRLRDPGLTAEDCTTVLEAIYRDHKTINVLPVGTYPATKWVKNTNKAFLSVQVEPRTSRLILMCVVDNLVKGQAGQGVQCLNIMDGLPANMGLPNTTFYP
ncbi:N-acetyl-gamma-glutamyl-phosphate reductase [Prochlorococcus sp. MIT 1341]|uniref:N-acetyl-gamma-glutamyl-phosphate reductase n=1 Tax=Prochlorococcus sp. MIT 1341 TaxID=3096221 RepID=UPI002A7498D9|nr:N-acetyl-gamma-glutamyl-phosphate reductase [Prochlorococcus sp. MIT 1341]